MIVSCEILKSHVFLKYLEIKPNHNQTVQICLQVAHGQNVSPGRIGIPALPEAGRPAVATPRDEIVESHFLEMNLIFVESHTLPNLLRAQRAHPPDVRSLRNTSA